MERLEAANQFILAISNHGRKFFRYENNVAWIEIAKDGKLFLHNEWNGHRIYISKYGAWKHFHHGGTLHSVIGALVEFIKTGCKLRASFFDSHWAYGEEEINHVIEKGLNLNVLYNDRIKS